MMTLVTMRDVPPSSKKLSVAPTLSMDRIPAKMSQKSFSTSPSGATYSRSSTWICGAGRARRFTFWFWFNGMASICIVAAGTMYGGLRSLMKAFSACTSTFSSLTI